MTADEKRIIAAVNELRLERIATLTAALRRARTYIGGLTFESQWRTECLAAIDEALKDATLRRVADELEAGT